MPLLAETVADAARRFGSRSAVVAADGWPLSYRDLDAAMERAAAGLHAAGLRAGDLLALRLPSSPDHLVAYLAAARIGAVTVGVNPRLPGAEAGAVLAALAPRLVIGTEPLLDGVDVDAETVLAAAATCADELLACLPAGGPAPRVDPDPDRPVALVLTSATTGAPKAAVFADRQLRAVASIDVGDRRDGGGPMLASTELVHVGVVTKLPWYLRTGATLHLLARWRAADALDAIVRERVPVIGAISTQVALLLRELGERDVSHVQAIVAGGGPSPAALVAEARARFGAPYSIRYSSTESGGVGTGTAFDADDAEALHTVGCARAGVEVEVRRADGSPAATGEVGVVHLRSPAVMSGYWRDAEATAAALVGGWLRTDDLGVIDSRGCLRLAGRRSEVYIRGGYNVHPQRVEAALADHPEVAEVVVVPRPDPIMGQVGVAVVVARNPARPPSLESLRAVGATRLARYELPEAVVAVDGLPRNGVDKIDRRAVLAQVTSEI